MKKRVAALVLISVLASLSAGPAWACASFSCSISSDWETQGFSTGRGWAMDIRYDYLNQNEVRSGSGTVGQWPVAGHEQELSTQSRNLTLGLDYSPNPRWGVNLQLPYIERYHATNGTNFDGSDNGTSRTSSLGDARVVGRYQGFTPAHNVGVQFGLKLPTGSHKETFSGGAMAGEPLDRGLQPGTGSTDLLLGAFRFGTLSQKWDYFAQSMVQVALDKQEDYSPGKSLNLNLGFRYMGLGKVQPQLQFNARFAGKDKGQHHHMGGSVEVHEDANSGGETLHISPGVVLALNKKIQAYAFVQLPLYQYLNGYQLAPKYTLSVGTRFAF